MSVYLADDHQIIIDGLQLLLSSNADLVVVGSANDGETAAKEIKLLQPDIAIVDMRMPGLTGLQVVQQLAKTIVTRFIILSMHNDKRYVIDAQNAGASGYLLKDAGKKEMMDCIETVIAHGVYFPNDNSATIADNNALLTPREIDILRMIITESSSQQIADELGLSLFTIETHRRNILRKTKTKNAVALIRWATENSLLN